MVEKFSQRIMGNESSTRGLGLSHCLVGAMCVLSCLVRSDSWDPMNWDPRSPLDSSALLPLEFPGVNTAAGCHVLFRGASQLRGRALCFLSHLHCRQILLPPLHLGRQGEQVKVEPIKIARQTAGFFF